MEQDFPMELITGIEKIDLQHMELMARVKLLYDSYLNGTNPQEIIKIFSYLKCYVEEHFKTEENAMIEYEYPGYNGHKAEHTKFYKEYETLEKKFVEKGITADFNLELNIKIIDWLKNHVLQEDKFMADYIKAKNQITSDYGVNECTKTKSNSQP